MGAFLEEAVPDSLSSDVAAGPSEVGQGKGTSSRGWRVKWKVPSQKAQQG